MSVQISEVAAALKNLMDPLAETAAYREALDHVKKVVLRCFATYKTTFPESLADTDTIKLAVETLQLVCAASGDDFA
eukprot:SAG22_NODE_20600_length_264_cov_0.842424_1_plen_76_part_01